MQRITSGCSALTCRPKSRRHDVRPWHHGRRFFVCHCGYRAETIDGSALDTCEECGRRDFAEWVPPAVRRARQQPSL